MDDRNGEYRELGKVSLTAAQRATLTIGLPNR